MVKHPLGREDSFTDEVGMLTCTLLYLWVQRTFFFFVTVQVHDFEFLLVFFLASRIEVRVRRSAGRRRWKKGGGKLKEARTTYVESAADAERCLGVDCLERKRLGN